MDRKIVEELENIVGKKYVSTRKDVLLTYSASASTSYDPVLPGAIVRPGNTEEVSKVLKLASGHRIPVTPRSGGTSLQGEVIPKPDGLVMDLLRLEGIEIFEELRSVKVGAGVTFGQLDKFLNQYDLWVSVAPESALAAAVAGNVAVNGAGLGSARYGCIGELVLGLEVVLPDGRIIQTGSEANPNSPGPFLRYAFGPDITGLFIGSLGAFGIITKVSFKTFKRIHNFYYQTYGFDTAEQAQNFLIQIKQNEVHPLFAAFYEGRILDFFLDMVGEEFGVPQYDWPPFTVSMTLGRLRKDQLESDVEMTKNTCTEIGGHVIGVEELPRGEWTGRLWNYVRSSYVHGWWWRMLYHHQTLSNWHRSVEEIWRILDEYGLVGHTAGFLAGHTTYNLYPQLYYFPDDPEEEEKVKAAHKELAKRLHRSGAVPFKLAPYWVEGVKEVEPYFKLLQSIKKMIDPNNIMNPGVIPGIEGDATRR